MPQTHRETGSLEQYKWGAILISNSTNGHTQSSTLILLRSYLHTYVLRNKEA